MRESRLSGSVEGVTSNHDPYSDSPEPWLVRTTKVYSGVGADIVMESITLIDPARIDDRGSMSDIAIFRQLTLPQWTGRRGSPQLGRRTHGRNSRNRKALAVVTSATILVTPSNR
jgi:hypothetical protein